MNKSAARCWICGVPAASGEHIPKKATVRDVFGVVSQAQPLYHSSAKQRNRMLQSINSTQLKLRVLCGDCNSGLTQPYDRAWDQWWRYLSSNALSLANGAWIRRSRVFSSNVAASMMDLHLYAVKLMGCAAAVFDLNLDMAGMADAMKRRKAYPWVFLGVGNRTWVTELNFAGPSDLCSIQDEATGRCVYAVFFLVVGGWEFQFVYAAPGQIREGMRDCWNPVSTRLTRKLRLKEFEAKQK